jgi:DNA-binding NarL/FixJ family response regulator
VFDANPLFRAGIIHVLSAEPDMEVVAEGGSMSDALRRGAELSSDVVILDSDLMTVDMNLWRSIIGICPDVKMLVMAFSVDENQVLAAFAAGARGYVLKGVSGCELIEAVRALHRDEGYVSPALAATMLTKASLAGRMKTSGASALNQLTHRENEIFDLLASGLKNREIGRRLDVSEKTIKRYVTRIFEKLHVRNRVEAAMLSKAAPRPQPAPKGRRALVDLASPVLESRTVVLPIAGSNGGAPQRGNGQAPRG